MALRSSTLEVFVYLVLAHVATFGLAQGTKNGVEVVVENFAQLMAALGDESIDTIRVTALLENTAGSLPVEVSRAVRILPAAGVADVVWDQSNATDLIVVGENATLSIEGAITFVGCVAESSAVADLCQFSPFLPLVFDLEGGAVEMLQGTQVVCQPTALGDPRAGELLQLLGAMAFADFDYVDTRRVVYSGTHICPGSNTSLPSNWIFTSTTAVWDGNGCFEKGLAVTTGGQLQKALSPESNAGTIYLTNNVIMEAADWPENGTHVVRPVNIYGCHGVVWDTNHLSQMLYTWSGGHITIDGRKNLTIANSLPSSRRGNVWALVGAFSVEVNGSITMSNLKITGPEPSAIHPLDVNLNPPENWPLPCCDGGVLIHHSLESLTLVAWELVKAQWVLASTGVTIPEDGFWRFINVENTVITAEGPPCFEDFGVKVWTPSQFYNALKDPELIHIEVASSLDLHAWTAPVTVSRPGVIVRGCSPANEPFVILLPAVAGTILVEGAGSSLKFEQNLLLQQDDATTSDGLALSVAQGGAIFFVGITITCPTADICPVSWAETGPSNVTYKNGEYIVEYLAISADNLPGMNTSDGGLWVMEDVTLETGYSVDSSGQGGLPMAVWILVLLIIMALAMVVLVAVLVLFAIRRKSSEATSEVMDGGKPDSRTSLSSDVEQSHGSGRLKAHIASLGHLPAVETNSSRVQIMELLGTGGHAKVYRGIWRGVVVALKIIQLPPDAKKFEKQEESLLRETTIAASFRHPNVIQTYSAEMCPVKQSGGGQSLDASPAASSPISDGASSSGSRSSFTRIVLWEVHIIQEYCNRLSLHAALSRGMLPGQSGRKSQPPLDVCLRLAHDVACGMNYIHDMQIVHGDLKAQNVLLCSQERERAPNLVAKIADFGLSHLMDGGQTHVSGIQQGTMTHMAPEVLLTGRMTRKTDVYAFGIMLYELFSGRRPFDALTAASISHAVVHLHKRPMFPPGTPVKIVELACQCWNAEPTARPDFNEITERLDELIELERSGALMRRESFGDISSTSSHLTRISDIDDVFLDMKSLQTQGNVRTSSPSSDQQSERNVSFNAVSLPSSHAASLATPAVRGSDSDEESDDDESDDGAQEGNTVVLTSAMLKSMSERGSERGSRAGSSGTLPT